MNNLIPLGTFLSCPLLDEKGDPGQWVYEAFEEEAAIKRSGDPRAYVMKKLAAHLAGLVEAYGLPPTLWKFRATKRVRSLLNLPEEIDLSQGLH